MIKLKLALRYLLRKPITLFAVISVMLGAAAFVVVMGVMDGYISEFQERSRMRLSDMIVEPRRGELIRDPESLMKRVAGEVEGIRAWSPVIKGIGMAKVRGADGSFALRWCHFFGVDPEREYEVTRLAALSDVSAESSDWIIPGRKLLGTRTPEEVKRIVLVTSARTPGGVPRKRKLDLIATVTFGLDKPDTQFAYIPRRTARELTSGRGDAPRRHDAGSVATEIRVRIDNPDRSLEVKRDIQAVLDSIAFKAWQVRRYQETNSIYEAHELQRSLARLFVAAGFAVVAISYMIVLQKTRDVGTLRTLGLSRGGVLATFVGYGVSVGVSGAALGIGLGVFVLSRLDWVRAALTKIMGHDPFPATLYALDEVPHEVNVANLLLIVGVAIVVSFIGSLYPAWRAARLNVVESLRYE